MSISTAILGASGYAGAELLRLLAGHPHFKPAVLIADSTAGEEIGTLYRHLNVWGSMRCRRLEGSREEIDACELVFSALPHGEAMKVLPTLGNKVVIDLSGDFRLHSADEYRRWYGKPHEHPELLGKWTYGLPELFRGEIQQAVRIANPGCYATAAILALAPLVGADLVEQPMVVDAISGVSGAGRGLKLETHFCQAAEDLRAYRIGAHQHTPEIELALQRAGKSEVKVSFTAHLAPVVRGINATCSAQLKRAVSAAEIVGLYRELYSECPFITVESAAGGTKRVAGTNRAAIAPFVDARLGRAIVVCALDNLVKGAAGQALQNANLAFGFAETLALDAFAVFP